MAFLAHYWYGNGPLWRIFWIYGVAVSFAVAAVVAVLGLLNWISIPLLIVLLVLLALYTVWILVSVWRCAENISGWPLGVDRMVWAWFARWLTIAWAINLFGLSVLLVQMSAE